MPVSSHSIFIILPIYNGMAYSGELIASVLKQSMKDWKLLVRDDGSTDGTRAYLESINDDRIEILENSDHVGVRQSFNILIGEALNRNAELIFFCDCDDVWSLHKLARMHQAVLSLSPTARSGPLLFFSELRVVDKKCRVIHNSLLKYAGWTRREGSQAAEALLGGNFVTGCSVALNRSAASLVYPIPSSAGLHDGWSALLVSWAGEIHFLQEPLVDYRLHGENTVGITRPWRRVSRFFLGLPATWSARIKISEMRFRRAFAARSRLLDRKPLVRSISRLEQFLSLLNSPCWSRPFRFWTMGFQWHSFLGKLAFTVTLPWINPDCISEKSPCTNSPS